MSAPETSRPGPNETRRGFTDGSTLILCGGHWAVACGPDFAGNDPNAPSQAAAAAAIRNSAMRDTARG
ncbi:MAG: hypothetical protein RLW87_07000 [Alphaproteobacteria bacterium]|jgi:hypothetical protein